MLKTPSSVVLASLKTSTYHKKVRLGLSLAAALLAGRFEHPGPNNGSMYLAVSTQLSAFSTAKRPEFVTPFLSLMADS